MRQRYCQHSRAQSKVMGKIVPLESDFADQIIDEHIMKSTLC